MVWRQLAEEAATILPRKAVVGLLYDIGKQLVAVMDEE